MLGASTSSSITTTLLLHTEHVTHNLAQERYITLSLIGLNISLKISIKTKHLLTFTSDQFRTALLCFKPSDGNDDICFLHI